MKQLSSVAALASLLVAAINAQASPLVYNFNDGTMQGWKNIRISSESAGYYDLSFGAATQTGHDGWGSGPNPIWSVTGGGTVPPTGPYFLGEIPFENQTNLTDWLTWPAASSGVQQTIIAQSPAFTLDGSGPLTYLGCGVSQSVPLTTFSAIPEVAGTWGADSGNPVSTKGNCAVGLLRDDGVFVLSKDFQDGGSTWKTYTFTTSELAPFVNDGHTYTLNVVDFWSGKNSWCAIDDITIPATLPELRVNAALNSAKTGLVLTWSPTLSGQPGSSLSSVLVSDNLNRPATNWSLLEVVPTQNTTTSVEIPLTSTNTFFRVRQQATVTDFPPAMQYGAPIQFEIWQSGANAASQRKIMNLTSGAKIPGELLPWDGVRYTFRVPVPHDTVTCRAYSSSCFDHIAWGPETVLLQGSESRLYYINNPVPPVTGRYYVEAEARKNGQLVAKTIVPFEIVRSAPNYQEGLLGVGVTNIFPQPTTVAAPIEFQLWQWGNDNDPSTQKKLFVLTNGMKISVKSLPKDGMYYRFSVPVMHDRLKCECYSSDCFDKFYWDEAIAATKPLYRCTIFPLPFQAGKYNLGAEAKYNGVIVAKTVINIEIVQDAPAQGSHYTQGKQDVLGNPVTFTEPINLGPLNQTPVLVDNDYPFAPQQAYYSINWERFPPFQMPARFVDIYGSRRFLDETNFGDPLSRGFKTLAIINNAQDNLLIKQRNWFHTPDQQVSIINELYAQDPVKYKDLKAYALYRSAFVSATNAYLLGWRCYDGWGAGGYAPYDPGVYGWDEEQMWPTIGIDMIRNHPDMVPQEILSQFASDPQLTSPNSQALAQALYTKAWGDFVGNTYRGARDCAASRGRVFKVWHYGSRSPGDSLFLGSSDWQTNSVTGVRHCDELSTLHEWFKIGDRINYEASEYCRQIDYFHKDFYYHVLFPETSSMYVKSGNAYTLGSNGRRIIRTDVFSEKMYAPTVTLGHEDCAAAPMFLKHFIAMGENAMFFLNGAKYYKKHGTFVSHKQMLPALRPANQETWGETAQFGSRPVSPYMAEASSIFTYMIGLEGLYLWDSHNYSAPIGQARTTPSTPAPTDAFGDIEFIVKGMHRVSQFNSLFEGDYSFVRPMHHYNTTERDHPLIRGIINGRYIVLAMTNPYLDPGETQQVELWYDAPYAQRTSIWSGTVTLQSRKNHIFHCQLPALPNGAQYDPDKLYFRYTCADGNYTNTYTQTGNYEIKYPY